MRYKVIYNRNTFTDDIIIIVFHSQSQVYTNNNTNGTIHNNNY